ncbi:hypothetical protein [Streptomyces sp. NPDC098781]|uniref:hypothetical protein n=1 Tax=Streptomyces sp. NPDC098781 TaxID=3366097 RepID=UPI00381681FB
MRSPTPCSRRAQTHPPTRQPVTATGTRTPSTPRGSSACRAAVGTALGRYRKWESSYGEPPADQTRAARTTIALSIPSSEVTRAVRTTRATSTAPSATHRCQVARRTNHPEMSLLRSPTL